MVCSSAAGPVELTASLRPRILKDLGCGEGGAQAYYKDGNTTKMGTPRLVYLKRRREQHFGVHH